MTDKPDTPDTHDAPRPKKRTDAEEAVRFMAIKAAIFILIPALAAALAAYVVLSKV